MSGGGARFRPEAFDAIERAVQEAERATAGEIVPLVVGRSSDYAGVRAVAAALVAFAAGVVVLATSLPPWVWLPPIQLAAFGLAWGLSDWSGLLRRLVPESLAEERVHRAARLAFVEQGLHETRDRSGILIYVSLFEHRVELLADRGIHLRVEPGTWYGIVNDLTAALRRGRTEEGLCEAIRRCGEQLARSFPRRADDANELADRLRTDADVPSGA